MGQRLRFLKGKTYILGIEVDKDIKISIGKLGNIGFRKGFYLYVGSAKNRLSARLRRHLSRDKRLFWHIDYLLSSNVACVKEVWISSNKGECSMARLIGNHLESQFIRGFGSSDCRCPGHLVLVYRNVSLVKFLKRQGFKRIKLNYAGQGSV